MWRRGENRVLKMIFLKKLGHSRLIFRLIFVFSIQLRVNKCSVRIWRVTGFELQTSGIDSLWSLPHRLSAPFCQLLGKINYMGTFFYTWHLCLQSITANKYGNHRCHAAFILPITKMAKWCWESMDRHHKLPLPLVSEATALPTQPLLLHRIFLNKKLANPGLFLLIFVLFSLQFK